MNFELYSSRDKFKVRPKFEFRTDFKVKFTSEHARAQFFWYQRMRQCSTKHPKSPKRSGGGSNTSCRKYQELGHLCSRLKTVKTHQINQIRYNSIDFRRNDHESLTCISLNSCVAREHCCTRTLVHKHRSANTDKERMHTNAHQCISFYTCVHRNR